MELEYLNMYLKEDYILQRTAIVSSQDELNKTITNKFEPGTRLPTILLQYKNDSTSVLISRFCRFFDEYYVSLR